MTFAPLRVGGWAFGQILTSADMNQLNEDLPFAIDGRAGGTYSPTGYIVIGGPGLVVGTLASVAQLVVSEGANVTNGATTDTLAVTAGAHVAGGLATDTLDVTGAAEVHGALTVSALLESASLAVTGASSIDGVFTAHSTSAFVGAASFGAPVEFSSTVQMDDGANMGGDLTFSSASLVERMYDGTDANGTYSVSFTDCVHICFPGAPFITANRVYGIDEVRAIDGKKLRMAFMVDAVTSFTVQPTRTVDGSNFGVLLGSTSGKYQWIDFRRCNGRWQFEAGYKIP